ncbi:DUF397 domain-containing protein [Actinomadura oligospora]|uniref:DUF397 domain-containing protein n=1 Tax=Actinomadura oligospora TaxID=111804 RepID=UPI00047BF3F4|nr:DUF397 domain-containing protein [Actinomadura oligospora]
MADRQALTHARWRKSSHSGDGGPGGGDCVEVTDLGGICFVRDSKDPNGPVVGVSPETWSQLVRSIKYGETANAQH